MRFRLAAPGGGARVYVHIIYFTSTRCFPGHCKDYLHLQRLRWLVFGRVAASQLYVLYDREVSVQLTASVRRAVV